MKNIKSLFYAFLSTAILTFTGTAYADSEDFMYLTYQQTTFIEWGLHNPSLDYNAIYAANPSLTFGTITNMYGQLIDVYLGYSTQTDQFDMDVTPIINLGPYFSGPNPYTTYRYRYHITGPKVCSGPEVSANCAATMGVRGALGTPNLPLALLMPTANTYTFTANAGGSNFGSFNSSGNASGNVTLHTFDGAPDQLVASNSTYSFGTGGAGQFQITDPPLVLLTFTDNSAIDFSIDINTDPASSSVPEPSTLLLLGSGLTGLVAMRRFRFKK